MRKGLLALAAASCLAAAGCGFGSDGSSVSGAALTAPESSWLPGQKALGAYSEFAGIFERAVELAQRRRKRRELALEKIERAKVAARNKADAAARRRYLEAKRRAARAYRKALERAAAERRRREAELRRLEAERARALAEREKKLRVPPGDECRLDNVRRRFNCRTGRLPDRQPGGKKRNRR
jgi:hypothetical protein